MRYLMLWGVLLTTAASASEPAPSAAPEARRTFVGLEAVELGRGSLAVDGERVLSPNLSVRLGLRLGARLVENGEEPVQADTSSFTLGAIPGLRYYLAGTALEGLWVGSQLELLHQGYDTRLSASSRDGVRNRSWSVGVAALVGYSVVVSPGLTVQGGVGLGANYARGEMTVRSTTLPGGESELNIRTWSWGASERATLAVGWAF